MNPKYDSIYPRFGSFPFALVVLIAYAIVVRTVAVKGRIQTVLLLLLLLLLLLGLVRQVLQGFAAYPLLFLLLLPEALDRIFVYPEMPRWTIELPSFGLRSYLA